MESLMIFVWSSTFYYLHKKQFMLHSTRIAGLGFSPERVVKNDDLLNTWKQVILGSRANRYKERRYANVLRETTTMGEKRQR